MLRDFVKPTAIFLVVIFALFKHGNCSDWSTYRGDNARLGSTDEQLQFPLKPVWSIKAPAAPQLAWSSGEGRVVEGKLLGHRVRFDDAFRTVISANRVYYGSTVDHALHCVDLQSGQELWRFVTGGPIRLAPTIASGKVLFGSDDGVVYSLEAATGKMNWKRRVAPRDEWLLARGEMISKWPVRTGVLVQGDVAYFGAGIFPHEDVYLQGVDLETGDLVWKADNISAQDAGRNDLSPQGYLLANEDYLVVPSGRSLPAVFSLKTGKMLHKRTHSWRSTAGGVVGGTRALLADGQIYTGGPHHFLAMTQEKGDVGFGWFEGRQMCIDGDDAYVATGEFVARLDRADYAAASRERHDLESQIYSLSRSLRNAKDAEKDSLSKKIKQATRNLEQLGDKGVTWRQDSPGDRSLLVTGSHVILGGESEVTSFDKQTGELVWKVETDGTPRGLAVSSGSLIVSTDTGLIQAFSSQSATVDEPIAQKQNLPSVPEETTTIVDSILNSTAVDNGFCLVVGCQDSSLLRTLAEKSTLKIYCVEHDAKRVAQIRKELFDANLYGHRVVVHQRHVDDIPYSNFFANLILSDHLVRHGTPDSQSLQFTRHLKPNGGVFWLGAETKISQEDATRVLSKTQLNDHSAVKVVKGNVTIERNLLPGSGNWSHQYGDAANTAVSRDTRVNGDLGVLWYGDPGPGEMSNRHEGAVGPLVINGRLIVQGEWTIKAYDAYNGVHLWTYQNPQAIRTGVFQNQNPGNLAASETDLFCYAGDQCFQLDLATGEQVAIHRLPKSVDNGTYEWGYVACENGLLFGTATIRKQIAEQQRRRGRATVDTTDSIFAIEIPTGKHLWSYQGKSISHHTIAIGPEQVYFIDSSITSEQRDELLRQDKSHLAGLTGKAKEIAEDRLKTADKRMATALDARTGEKLWANPVDVTDCSDIGIGGGKLTMMYSNGKLVLGGANANGHYWKQFMAGEFERRRLVVLSAEDGYKLWSKDANYRHRPIIIGEQILAEPWIYDLETGDQKMRPHPITGQDVPWSIMRTGHHCGMLTGADSGMLMFRSGSTGFFDLNQDEGVRHFAGHRLGCWINAVVANGLVLIPEASAGCVCQFSIASTIVLEPRQERRPWTIFSAVGSQTPVRHLAINLGAPGDRKDESGTIWFSYPRNTAYKETSLDVKLDLSPSFGSEGGFESIDEQFFTQIDSSKDWLYTSWAKDLREVKLRLVDNPQDAGNYRIRLHVFDPLKSNMESSFKVSVKNQAGRTLADQTIQLQGTTKTDPQTVTFESIRATDSLTVQLEPVTGLPQLNAIEAIRE